LIDAHYFYPDGVAAVMLGKMLGKPVTITALGTDITFIPSFYWPKKMILWAANQATAIVTVCQALKDELVTMGTSPQKIHVIKNGVDLAVFYPQDKDACRQQLNLLGPTLLSVGNLIELKGHHLIIQAMRGLPEYSLLIVGAGPELARLKKISVDLGVADRVIFLGILPQDQLAAIYSAADALVLASSREGLANVLLEAMACGTPVIATNVWGSPELVNTHAAGLLIKERSGRAIAKAVRKMENSKPTRKATRAYAEQFSWDDTAFRLYELFGKIIHG
jgi:glycosyltransferase involved in cell wall biosynthesis